LIKDYLLSLKEGLNHLFLSAEQGLDKRSNNILVIILPKQKFNVMKWVTKVYEKKQ